jgi:hypothetical protein
MKFSFYKIFRWKMYSSLWGFVDENVFTLRNSNIFFCIAIVIWYYVYFQWNTKRMYLVAKEITRSRWKERMNIHPSERNIISIQLISTYVTVWEHISIKWQKINVNSWGEPANNNIFQLSNHFFFFMKIYWQIKSEKEWKTCFICRFPFLIYFISNKCFPQFFTHTHTSVFLFNI